MTDPFALRLAADRVRLDELAAASGGRIVVRAHATAAAPRVLLDLQYPTAASAAYPGERAQLSKVALDFGVRYPFEPPKATFLSPILHPNVWPNGVVCHGARWQASEGMDLFVQRLIRLMTFDPLLVNVSSVANPTALNWYQTRRRDYPQAFPAERLDFASPPPGARRVRWDAMAERVLRPCPMCGAKLRLPAGRQGAVRCPRCAADFATTT